MEREMVAELLEARAYMYKLLHALLGQEPTAAMMELAAGEATAGALALFEALGDAGFAAAAQAYRARMAASGAGLEALLADATREYTPNFVGPSRLPAGPWECIYVNRDRSLLQESTLAVRDAYRAQGFLPKAYPSVSDDHVALELDFMAQLAKRATEAVAAGDAAAAALAWEAQEAFLSEHLCAWLPRYAAEYEAAAREGSVYAPIVRLAQAYCALDARVVAELRELVEPAVAA